MALVLLISLFPTNIQSASATHQQVCVTATNERGEELDSQCNVIDEEDPVGELGFCSFFPKVDSYGWLASGETWVKNRTFKGVIDNQWCTSTKKLKRYVYDVYFGLILVNGELVDTHQLRQYGNKKIKGDKIDIKLTVKDSQ